MKEIEITNFDLWYDGMYNIKWNDQQLKVFLELNTILKMLQIEGIGYEQLNEIIEFGEPLHFNKVTMIMTGEEENGKLYFTTSEFGDSYSEGAGITLFEINLKE